MKRLVIGATIAGFLTLNPSIGKAALGDQTLKPGMTHSEVKDLQTHLKSKGYFTYSGQTTNYFGSYTKSAVISFQKAKGLKADGIVGSDTFKALGIKSPVYAPTYSKAKLVNTAKKYMGVPYVWGGTSSKGFDCSGYLNYVYQEATGINLPRTVSEIFLKGTKVNTPQVGDMVFFETYKPGASHAGIYIGNNEFIHSSSSKGVSISSMKNSYWSTRYLGAKKY
ncbi:MAG: NlpC/P60 family protein [Bacillota bacterium]|uniref:C40 family peptidase n=1 Tax=Fictibacillus TaxID=1329200 RepID=UPI0018CD7370|nr:C40 family peptidase [Fictibacillus sp. 5RED26]MBH0159502.1 C40 family peptidase [Fictibacillus sp. 26RED30]MBH0163698.1 C40 family peptidase [Fictibacillus sp. 7GRE50]MBH0169675.1 C40 family peptidase [Fictibacillus sp. 18YEL24]MBH0174175.1 C40 family peptidase [Fictibacillus sp. 23RED33]